MARIVLGSIGLSKKYQEVNYFWPEENKAYRTKYFLEAVVNLFQPDKYYVFCTPQILRVGVINELKNCLGDVVKRFPYRKGVQKKNYGRSLISVLPKWQKATRLFWT